LQFGHGMISKVLSLGWAALDQTPWLYEAQNLEDWLLEKNQNFGLTQFGELEIDAMKSVEKELPDGDQTEKELTRLMN
jgi:hypothetical protein